MDTDKPRELVARDAAEQLRDLNELSKKLGESLSATFTNGIIEGRRLDEVLKQMGRSFVELSLRMAMAPLQKSLAGGLTSILDGIIDAASGGLAGGAAAARPVVPPLPPPRPFAKGGVIATPSYFAMPGGGLGLMGERGAEAILPLARGADGRLGVRAPGGGSERAPTIVVQVTTPDADSFRRSEAQVAAALARAVARGRRAT